VKSLKDALAVAPSDMSAQLQLVDVYLARRETKPALELLGNVLKARPQLTLGHFYMGQALLQSGDLQGAKREFLGLQKSFPASVDTLNWLGRTNLALGDSQQARREFEQAAKLDPGSLEALNGLVTLDIADKKPDAARVRVEAGLSSKPTDARVAFLAANTYLTLGDTQKAEALFTRVIELDPSRIDAFGRLGRIYLSQGRLDEARKRYEEAATHKDGAVAATTMVGIVLEMQNNRDAARAQYEKALAIDPAAAVAANNLAWIYADQGHNLDVALQLAQTAKAGMPDSSNASDTLGWVYYKKGLTDLAIAAFLDGAKLAQSDPIVRYHLGLAYAKNGDQKGAQRSLQEALKLNPNFRGADDAKRVLSTLKG